MMHELVKVTLNDIGGALRQTVNARELHAALDAGQDFSNWIKGQIARARLVESRDFVCSPYLASEGRGGQNRIDYHLVLDAAKHIAMMSGTDKGFEVRDYFLECERKVRGATTVPVVLSTLELIEIALQSETERLALAKKIAIDAPAVEFVIKYVDATGLQGFRQVCKLLGVKENTFREFLKVNGIMYQLGGEWVPHAQHLDAGRFEVKAGVSFKNDHAFNSARFTAKGVNWIAALWAKFKKSGASS